MPVNVVPPRHDGWRGMSLGMLGSLNGVRAGMEEWSDRATHPEGIFPRMEDFATGSALSRPLRTSYLRQNYIHKSTK